MLKWIDEESANDVMDLSRQLFREHGKALQDIRLGPMEFCEFDNMLEFRPLALFQNTASRQSRTPHS